MLSDRLLELSVLARLRVVFQETSPWTAIGTFLAIALFAVVADYGRMLWLRSKMVGATPHRTEIAGRFFFFFNCLLTILTAAWSLAAAHYRQHFHATGL